jgi:hypothetical protein
LLAIAVLLLSWWIGCNLRRTGGRFNSRGHARSVIWATRSMSWTRKAAPGGAAFRTREVLVD